MRRGFLTILIAAFLLLSLLMSGVYAAWVYFSAPQPIESDFSAAMGTFHYGTLYITKVEIVGGSYSSASTGKKSDVNINADLTLHADASSTVVVDVTFYNSTDVSYYYNKTETVSADNENIVYAVSGIEQKDEIPSKAYKTITVTFSYSGIDVSDVSLVSELHFNFVVDESSIGTIVAQTAVERFRDILNNIVSLDSYQVLEDAMNSRGGTFNKASAVTYIGNVSGATDSDSEKIKELFSEEFLSMDLDGDGNVEPITMMIKREDLDSNTQTGDSYTYTSWGREYTVYGVEMTIYITSEGFDSNSLVVYAATFTKLQGADQWTQLVPLTKGIADANNYNGWGEDNSFNTDTWESDSGKTIEDLVQEALAQ